MIRPDGIAAGIAEEVAENRLGCADSAHSALVTGQSVSDMSSSAVDEARSL
jgi:hypothetical protein